MTDEGQKALEAAKDAWHRAEYERKSDTEGMQDALRAWLAALSGWRLVPTQPSSAMSHIGCQAINYGQAWREMLEAAPPPPGLED